MQEIQYIREQFTREEDEVLKSISAGLEKQGFPQISVPPEVGKMLHMLVKISNASCILEIGALGATARSGWPGRCRSMGKLFRWS